MTTSVHYTQFFLACEEGDLNALQVLFSSLAPEGQRELLELGDWDCFQTVAHKGHAALLEFLITKLRGLYEPAQIDRLCDRHVFTNILCSVDMSLDALRKISPVRVQDRYDAILSALLPLCRDNGRLPRIHEKFHPCSSECYELAKEHSTRAFGSFTNKRSLRSTPFVQFASGHLVTLIQTLSPTEQDSVWQQFPLDLVLKNHNLAPLVCAAVAYQRQQDLQDLKNTPSLSLWQKFLTLFHPSKPFSPRISSLAQCFSSDPHSFFDLPETAPPPRLRMRPSSSGVLGGRITNTTFIAEESNTQKAAPSLY